MTEEQDDPAQQEPPKDQPFNPWRIPITAASRGLIAEVVQMFEGYELYREPRKRKRKRADQETFEATISAILCDLIHHDLTGLEGGAYLSLSNQVLGKRSRYRPRAYGKTLPSILRVLTEPEMGYINLLKGQRATIVGSGRRTTIRAAPRTKRRIAELGIALDDLGVSNHQEVIVLRQLKVDRNEKAKGEEYRDMTATNLYRQQMHDINGWLGGAEIEFDDSLLDDPAEIVDLGDRQMRRIFTQGRFDSCGRLFGGFWQALKKVPRREGMLIDGERVSELDYGQMNPRIVYGLNHVQPPPGDLYDIPGFRDHRSGIKKIMNALLFAKELDRFPPGVRPDFERRHRIQDVVRAIGDVHAAIKSRFFTGIGHRAMFEESQILVAVLLRLKDMGIVALPIHDAILVPVSKKNEAREVMLAAFCDRLGVTGVVNEETGR